MNAPTSRRLPRQELARGYTAKDMEFCAERLVQLFKTFSGRRVSSGPEKTFVNSGLQDRALSDLLVQDPALHKIRAVIKGQSRASSQKYLRLPDVFDGPSLYGGTSAEHMVERGRKLNNVEKDQTKAALQILFTDRGMPVADWVSTLIAGAQPSAQERGVMKAMAVEMLDSARLFKAAKFQNYQINTFGTGRGQSRANFFIQVC